MNGRPNLSPRTRKTALLGMLAAAALALSFLENLIPGLPGLPPGGKARLFQYRHDGRGCSTRLRRRISNYAAQGGLCGADPRGNRLFHEHSRRCA